MELYDQVFPEMRPRIEKFISTIIGEIKKLEIDVLETRVCRVKHEFLAAIKLFEKEDVDSIVTLHLAYSPSLESAEVLARTRIPIMILDTTPSFDFGPGVEPSEIMHNHGIHGVQDLCNVLIRFGKSFIIEAGHWKKSSVIKKIAEHSRAALMANLLKNSRVGSIGRPFRGMGDFSIAPDILKRTIGIENIEFLNAPADAIPLPDESVDLVTR